MVNIQKWTLAFVAIAACLTVFSSMSFAEVLRDPRPDTGVPERDLHMHDPSRIISVGEREIVAITGKEQTPRYTCGLEIWSRPSGSLGPWRQSDCILQEKPGWVATELHQNGGAYWAPDFVDQERILYSVSSGFEDEGRTCMGLAVLRDENWTDAGAPLTCTQIRGPDEPEISVIDPAFFRDTDGQDYVVTGGGMIHIAKADVTRADLGLPFDFPSDGWTPLARGPVQEADEHAWVEAAFMHQRGDHYYLFVNWGACCSGAASTYEIRVGRADTPFGPFLDREGRAMLDGHGTLVLESDGAMRGPGHVAVRTTSDGDVLSFHYYDADRNGLSWVGEARLAWDDGWPTVIPWR